MAAATAHIREMLIDRLAKTIPVVCAMAISDVKDGRSLALLVHVLSDDGERTKAVDFVGRKMTDDVLEAFLEHDLPYDDVVFLVTHPRVRFAPSADIIYRRPPVVIYSSRVEDVRDTSAGLDDVDLDDFDLDEHEL
jgi:hypothetical protein